MGTIVASSLIALASELAQDEDNVIWTEPQALSWVNDAQQAICILRPDASTVNHVVQLASGTKQSITGRRLISVHRNTNDSGSVPGKAIRLVDRKVKDEFNPDWHMDTASNVINEYVYNMADPKTYYVSPPVTSAEDVYIEVTEAINPAQLADFTDTINIDDVYSVAITEWMCYRFFGRDSEENPNHQRAMGYLRNFYHLFDMKIPADVAVSPSISDRSQ